MCGRYYVDERMAEDISRLVKEISDRSRLEQMRKDVFPSEEAAVLTGLGNGNGLKLSWQRWGFPGFQKSRVIFNARTETVLEKGMFRDSIKTRRILVPCIWFYEWSKDKKKTAFWREDEPVVYMGGIYKKFGEENRFVILTAPANEWVSPVHGRMPLIIDKEKLKDWMFDEGQAERMLKTPSVFLHKNLENGCTGGDALL